MSDVYWIGVSDMLDMCDGSRVYIIIDDRVRLSVESRMSSSLSVNLSTHGVEAAHFELSSVSVEMSWRGAGAAHFELSSLLRSSPPKCRVSIVVLACPLYPFFHSQAPRLLLLLHLDCIMFCPTYTLQIWTGKFSCVSRFRYLIPESDVCVCVVWVFAAVNVSGICGAKYQ